MRVFPLTGAVLFPRAVLPLNVFEPRYLAMTRDALAGDRLIGIVQPRGGEDGRPPPLFAVGGLGRITRFAETEDGRFLIALTGLLRFEIEAELAVDTPYRQVRVRYDRFASDLDPAPPLPREERTAIEEALRGYLKANDLSADWEAVGREEDEALVHTLAAVCPFDPLERQALVEAPDLAARARLLTELLAFGGRLPGPRPESTRLQ
ncbi:LON peptidase substrate-binding domain-containing protein [Thermaurantiacus sp.]|uniref:LON peptidase substrate-binding domain-containing protein n=1 Tax=Thermaurantiacus sp. TaxID=2820283 RepID=UPI00298EDCF6|nr:LON peptidase substrate-binding domain-containing protein [Thermaurantiacus sp.]